MSKSQKVNNVKTSNSKNIELVKFQNAKLAPASRMRKQNKLYTKIYIQRKAALKRVNLYNGDIQRILKPKTLSACGRDIKDYIVQYRVTWYNNKL